MGAMKTALTFLLIVASLFALFSGKAFATDPAAYGLLLKARGEGPRNPHSCSKPTSRFASPDTWRVQRSPSAS